MPEAGACIECHRGVRLVIQAGGQTKKGTKKPERYNLPPPFVPSAGAFCGSFPSTRLDQIQACIKTTGGRGILFRRQEGILTALVGKGGQVPVVGMYFVTLQGKGLLLSV